MDAVLLGITISEIDQYAGDNILPLIGSNMLIGAAIFIVLVMYAAVKWDLGWTASLVLAGFFIATLTTGLLMSGGGLIPAAVGIGFAIIFGLIIYKAFRPEISG